MANNNETTTKFKVDISDLKRAMQDARRITSIANSEFRAVSSSMDDWTKSTDGVSAKLKQLDTTLDAQKAVLNTLSREYAEVVAEQGENSRAAQDLLIRINNQRAAINNTTRDINRWSTALNELQSESNQTERATQSLTSLIDRQQNELNELKERYSNLVLEQGQSTQEARQLATQISNLSGELNENRNRLNNASNAADEFDQSLDDADQSAKKAEGGFTVLKGAIANLVAQAITKAVDTLKDLVTQANEVDKAINSLEASTGASAKEMKQYEKILKDIYKSNYGESYEDIAQSMSTIKNSLGDFVSDEGLKSLTENALALRDTFDFDVQESIRAAKSLMDQFGVDGEKAYDLIVQGAQNGLNQNGDLLDVINEYSVQFSNAGYYAEDMFNMLANGTKAGTWSVDKLGDAVKEMNIRFSDGTVKEALNENKKVLGLSKKEVSALQNEYNKGGDSAQKAVGKMIDSILSVKDETKQYQLGVSVFGTMWEDLGADAIKALMNTKGEINLTKEAMEDVKATKYDDVGSSLTQLGRLFKEEILKPVQDHIMPKLKELVDFAIKNFPEMVQTAKDFAKELKEWIPTLITIGTAIATYMVATKIIAFVEAIKNGTIALKLMTAAQTAFNAVMSLNPIGLVVAAIAALVVAFILLWKKSDAFREFWINLWEKIKEGTKVVIDAIGKFFTETVPNFFSNLITKVKDFANNVINAVKSLPSKIAEFFNKIPYYIGYALGAAIGTVLTWGVKLYNFAKTEIPKFINKTIEFFKQLPSKISTWLVNTITKITTWGANMVTKGKQAASNFITNVISFIKDLPSKIWSWLTQTVNKVANWGSNLASKGKEAAKKLFDSIVNKIKNLPSELKSMGSDIVKGLWNGINDMTGWIAKKIKGFGKGVTDGLKKFFKIKSPSRLMAEEVGRYLPEGIALGIDKNAKSVMNSMRNLATNTVGAARSGLSVGAGTGTIGGGVVNNFTQVINSPKQLSRVDIYRRSKNLLGYAGGV